ncbi:TonB-dependent receptor domain-containing protein [Roseobacter weihaiensis]|uniref:TonB-dependent receptor domain-containing protein n=1 Tax=Roseobacter weihaiensis TaxID=2763262 RepID=UPI001D0B0655|nr:TonB-dependent receptor [Roseobacter sp. H9]
MHLLSLRSLLRITTAVLCTASYPALSKDQETTDEETYLGTIILGESKRDVATDTAIPTTTIDEREIKDRQAGTIAELIDSVPGVTLVNGATAAGSGINIRGYGANGTFGTDQKVLIQVDGATKGSEELYRIGTQLYSDPFLFREVEVIRGTIGSFEYGSGVFGGVVRLETINASDILGERLGFGGRQTLEFSSNGDGITSSTILGWKPDENLELLFNYTRRTLDVRTDGNGDDINPDAGDLDDPSYLLKGRYTFGETRAHSLTFSYSNTEQEQFDVPYDTFGLANFGNVDRFIENEVASLRYNYDPAGSDLINLDVELTYSDELIESQAIDRSLPVFSLNLLDADNRYETTTLRIRNTALFEMAAVQHELRAGAEYILRERQDASAGAAPGGEKEVFALFLVDEMQIGDAWTIMPALRYETQEITEDPINGAAEFGDDALMGGLSLRYAFANGISVFGSGAYTVNLPIIDDISSDLIQQSERATTYEVGVAYDGQDVFETGDALALKLNYYTQESSNVTTIRAIGNPLDSVDAVDRDGFELEASYARQNGLYVDLNAHISDGEETLLNGTVQDYRFNPADSVRITLGQRISDMLDLSYELVAQRRYDEGTDIAPGFGVSNLRATYMPQRGLLEGTEIRFGIENVFDKVYQPRLSTRNATGRNFILTLAATF